MVAGVEPTAIASCGRWRKHDPEATEEVTHRRGIDEDVGVEPVGLRGLPTETGKACLANRVGGETA
jgi:hypothetical protein